MAENSSGGQASAKKEQPTCSSCPFFMLPPKPPEKFDLGHDINRKYAHGQCRRFPKFEPHEIDHWCGEHPEIARAFAIVTKRS